MLDIQKKGNALWKDLRNECEALAKFDIVEYPGLPSAYKYLKDSISNSKFVPTKTIHNLYDTYGLEKPVIQQLINSLGLHVEWKELEEFMNDIKMESRWKSNKTPSIAPSILNAINKPKTDDSHKYKYYVQNGHYEFPNLTSKIEIILKDGIIEENIENVKEGDKMTLLLDKTLYYATAGGQTNDKGEIEIINKEGEDYINLHVESIEKIDNYLFHNVIVKKSKECAVMSVGNEGVLYLDRDRRLNCMRNHTAGHLLISAIKTIWPIYHVKSSKIHHHYLDITFAAIGRKIEKTDVSQLEEFVRKIIKTKYPVKRLTVTNKEFLNIPHMTLNPGERYPHKQLHVISIDDNDNMQVISREACCGTHVLNTGDIDEFCIISFKSEGASVRYVKGVTGIHAKEILKNGNTLLKTSKELIDTIAELGNSNDDCTIEQIEQVYENLDNLRLEYSRNELSTVHHMQLNNLIKDAYKSLKSISKPLFRKKIIEEAELALRNDENEDYIVKLLKVGKHAEDCSSLARLVKKSTVPVLVLQLLTGRLKARCYVPKEFVRDEFSADKWVAYLCKSIDSKIDDRGEELQLMCCMVPKTINNNENEDEIIKNALNSVNEFARKYHSNT